jgi:hypothetical protein
MATTWTSSGLAVNQIWPVPFGAEKKKKNFKMCEFKLDI